MKFLKHYKVLAVVKLSKKKPIHNERGAFENCLR